jgi:high-affinity Fe2+/Pb2+ permease
LKTFSIALGTTALAVVLVVAGFLVGSIWRQSRWGYNVTDNGMMGPIGVDPK